MQPRMPSARLLRLALALSLAYAWANLLLTRRYAHVPGALHGWKLPVVVAVLSWLTWLAWRTRDVGRSSGLPRGAGPAVAAGGLAVLSAAFLTWFPPSEWGRIPFLDNWPPRFASTQLALDLLRHGTLAGWNWAFLGGYPVATDVTQHHAVLAWLPTVLLGPAVGFHVVHVLLFAAVPLLAFLDVRDEGPEVAWPALGLVALISANYSYFLVRSGDTNSLAGVVCAAAALVGSHAAARGRRWGAPVLVLGLSLAGHAHAGFFWYAVFYLVLEAAYFRDVRRALRLAVAAAAGIVAGLPSSYETYLYPSFFVVNNTVLDPASLTWTEQARELYYNVELLWQPWRWFNDYMGLTVVLVPLLAWVAWHDRSRVGFHAAGALATLALSRLDVPLAGYLFLRPVHLLPWFLGVAIAGLAVRHLGRRALAWAVIAFTAIYIQVWWTRVPHVDGLRDFDAALVDHVAALDGHLVLFENSPHRNVNATRGQASVKTPFGVHFEPMLPGATAKRFYAGFWDGWQWVPWRADLVAGGTWRGRAIADAPPGALETELRKWGVRHLVVWSAPTRQVLDASPRFTCRWVSEPWAHYELVEADTRAVVARRGDGTLDDLTPLSARVTLRGAVAGDEVVVRARYHPAWRAADEHGTAVPIRERDGQMALSVPRDGDQSIRLSYRTHPWLLPLSALAVLVGAVAAGSVRARSAPREMRDGTRRA